MEAFKIEWDVDGDDNNSEENDTGLGMGVDKKKMAANKHRCLEKSNGERTKMPINYGTSAWKYVDPPENSHGGTLDIGHPSTVCLA